jgi:adenylate cyclase
MGASVKDPFEIRIYDKQELAYESGELTGPVELGRQVDDSDGPLYSLKRKGESQRLVIARLDEDTISRKHILVEPLAKNRVRLTNLRDRLSLRLQDHSELPPRGSCELTLPYLLPLGSRKSVRLSTYVAPILHSLPAATRPPRAVGGTLSGLRTWALSSAAVDKESVLQWLQDVMAVLQSASNSSDFFDEAAQAAVKMVDLDSCRVLLKEKDGWKTQAFKSTGPGLIDPRWQPSQLVLGHVKNDKKTFWQMPDETESATTSLAGVTAVVAAPILDRNDEVIGALYGERRHDSRSLTLPQITNLEARFVELLACGIAAGLARLNEERAHLRSRVQFEQFFTPKLSRQLASQPDLLEGKDAEVTILFCDIRGFSRISERLGPARTVEWINDVLDTLSDCVLTHDGVLVDYIGDELMAMWGAPEQQPAHAKLACCAALDMVEEVPKLNARWQRILAEPFALGIGVNTGPARVGNTGSHLKFKYGALGNTVNLASRVQGVTKYLKTSLLVTGSTHAQLDATFDRRRIGKVQVVNIAEPVELFEVRTAGHPDWPILKQSYEKALEDFEKKEFRSAARILGNLCVEHAGDGPPLVLLSRTVNSIMAGPEEHHPVWVPPGK